MKSETLETEKKEKKSRFKGKNFTRLWDKEIHPKYNHPKIIFGRPVLEIAEMGKRFFVTESNEMVVRVFTRSRTSF